MIPLIVDDEPAIREIFTQIVIRQGHTPCAAANGQECLDLLMTVKPDIVLLDIMMQPMDGWDTLTAIRTSPVMPDLPVAMFSGKPPSPGDLVKYSAWIDDYLLKPLDFRSLSGILAEIVERSRGRNETIRRIRTVGKNPALAEEYREVEKSLYVYRKFSSPFQGEEYDAAIRLREERLQQIAATIGSR